MVKENEYGEKHQELWDEGSSETNLQRGFMWADLQQGTYEINNSDKHFSLTFDLVKHLWAMRGRTYY